MNSYRFFVQYGDFDHDEFWIDANTYGEALDLAIEKIGGDTEDVIKLKPIDWICFDDEGNETDELI